MLSFAFQKRTLAFYRATQNAPFGVIRVENAIPEKVCKSAAVFAHNSGNGVSGRAIRGLYGLEKRGGRGTIPDWGSPTEGQY
jgi:hypothetical protein